MYFIDTHSHLYLNYFKNDIAEVIHRASDSGVKKIILPNIDNSTIGQMHGLADKNPEMFIPLLGLHPNHVKDNHKSELEKIFYHFSEYNYKGIGEIGIDLYWDKTYAIEQEYVFKEQLHFAKKNNLPVVIHARESFREIIDIVKKKEFEGVTGIFHAFTGDIKLAQEIINLGFNLGIGGVLTFKNSGLSEVIKKVDINHIVLETDSPYLTPAPFRGKRNESAHIKIIAEKLAEIKNITIEEVAGITSANAEKIFAI
ncbi:MAG: TatD family hydrolase [Bacteroidales bacterium]|nr:TatD family hydrolase [Bacteroidales bacterium]